MRFLLRISPQIQLRIKLSLHKFTRTFSEKTAKNAGKGMKTQPQKVNFEVFFCPGTLNINLIIEQQALHSNFRQL